MSIFIVVQCGSNLLWGTVSLLQRDIPIVCIDRKPNIKESIAIVESDNYTGGFLATEELINQGCENILIIKSSRNISTTQLRFKGYQEALKKYNISTEEDLVLDLDHTMFKTAKDKIGKLVNEGVNFDGIFATNDWLALGSLFALKERGMNILGDVKIIGFDNVFISKYSYPSITTVNQDKEKLGEKASKSLLNFINKDETREKLHIVLPVTLVRRETT